MPVLYLPALRRRLRDRAARAVDQMAGALTRSAPAAELGLRWRLTEDVRGFAAVYGIEVYGGDWPQGARPTLRLKGSRIVSEDRAVSVPSELLSALRALDVQSWEALRTNDGGAFRFRPLGATFVASVLPPLRYVRGLNAEETAHVVAIARLSAELVGLRRPTPTTPTDMRR